MKIKSVLRPTRYAPMLSTTYYREIVRMHERFTWLKDCDLDPWPGHLYLLRQLLEGMTQKLSLEDREAIKGFSAGHKDRYLRIVMDLSALPKATQELVLDLVVTITMASTHTCAVCARPLSIEPFHQGVGFCWRHIREPKQFAEQWPSAPRGQRNVTIRTKDLPKLVAPPGCFLPTVQLYEPSLFLAFVANSQTRPNELAARHREIVARMRKAGQEQRALGVMSESWPAVVDEFEQQFPNFHEYAELLRDQFALAALGDGRVALSPVLLVGEPGIGKTQAVRWLSERLGLPYRCFDMASVQTSATLSGSETFWSNSAPGGIFELLAYEATANPLVLLDELDKVGQEKRYDPQAALYSLLEPASAQRFFDQCIRDFWLDASHINWLATANRTQPIPEPILSRFTVLHIPPPTTEQAMQIVQHIYGGMQQRMGWGRQFPPSLSQEAAACLVHLPPRVSRLVIERGFGAAARAGRREVLPGDLKMPTREKGSQGIGFLAPVQGRGVVSRAGESFTSKTTSVLNTAANRLSISSDGLPTPLSI